MNYTDSPTISKILIEAQQGNKASKEQVANWLMDEVQAKVLSVLNEERSSTTQSSLISKVLVKLVRSDTIQRAPSVFYLHAAVAKATREILIDLWRQQQRRQAKNGAVVASNEKLFRKFDEMEWDVIELSEALDLLETIDPRKALVVTSRFFCDMTVGEVAQQIGVSNSTVETDWRIARAWLFEQLRKDV
jgi:RNA polymerase sigma factor (TIGR02999 family)